MAFRYFAVLSFATSSGKYKLSLLGGIKYIWKYIKLIFQYSILCSENNIGKTMAVYKLKFLLVSLFFSVVHCQAESSGKYKSPCPFIQHLNISVHPY